MAALAAVTAAVTTFAAQGVAEAVNETGTSAGQVLDAATELSKNGERLRSEVDAFIASVRAA